MNRERAETHLRLLAEAELRRATTWPADGGLLDECHSARFELVAQALHAVRAFDMGAANEIQAELGVALGVRQPRQGLGGLAPNAQANLARLMLRPPRPGAGHRQPPSPHAPWRVLPVGQVIRDPGRRRPGRTAPAGIHADRGRRAIHCGQLPGTGPAAGAAQAASRRPARPSVHRGRRPGHQLSVQRKPRARPRRVVGRARPASGPAAGDPLA